MISLIEDMRGSHPGRVKLVLSNTPNAAGIAKAIAKGIKTKVVDYQAFENNNLAFEKALNKELEKNEIDIVCLAGFMHILSLNFVSAWKGRLLNIHPSLLPKYKGLDTHQRAIDAGDCEAGCTVHEVVAELDSGLILGQSQVAIIPGDTAESLSKRVLEEEHILYPKVLRNFIDGVSKKRFKQK